MYTVNGRDVRTICIIGAGNIGHYLMALMGRDPEIAINVLTSDPSGFTGTVESTNVNNGEVTVGHVALASSDPAEVIPSSDVIIFTTPSNAYKGLLAKIYPYVSEGAALGFIPGSGGAEFLAKDFVLNKHCCLFGAQRVPSGTKVIVKGQKVNSLGNRKEMRFAAIPGTATQDVCDLFHGLLGLEGVPLPNYLSVTLTPSNPILHTSRLYGLFHDYKDGMVWDEHLAFYKNWDLLSAEMLLGCNAEEQAAIAEMKDYDLTGVLSLVDHYEIDGAPGDTEAERMMNKLRTLPFLKDYAPMDETADGHFVPALGSRYFHEDFPYGLCIIRSFCGICGVPAPTIDKVLHWYESLFDSKYYVDDAVSGEAGEAGDTGFDPFCGPGLADLPLPQNEGMKCTADIKKYYDALEEAASARP